MNKEIHEDFKHFDCNAHLYHQSNGIKLNLTLNTVVWELLENY